MVLGSDASLAREPPGWALRTVEWILEADRAAVPILGICFGAQALAVAMGGGVVVAEQPEHDWIEVRTADAARVPSGPWLSVHEDTVVLPQRADRLADNPRGVQAFAVGRHVGLQFHPEITPPIVSRWVSEYGRSIGRELLVDLEERCRAGAPPSLALFDAFVDGAVPALTTDQPR